MTRGLLSSSSKSSKSAQENFCSTRPGVSGERLLMYSSARHTRSWVANSREEEESGGEGRSFDSDLPLGGVWTNGAGGEDAGEETRLDGSNCLNDITREKGRIARVRRWRCTKLKPGAEWGGCEGGDSVGCGCGCGCRWKKVGISYPAAWHAKSTILASF